jgi:hypothetical protein
MMKFPPPWRGGFLLKADEIPPKLHDREWLRGLARAILSKARRPGKGRQRS